MKYPIVLIATMFACNAVALEPRQACLKLSQVAESISAQLPKQMDSTTVLSSVSVFFVLDRCRMTYIYRVSEEKFIDAILAAELQNGTDIEGISRTDIIDLLNSSDGRDLFRQNAVASLSPNMLEMLRAPFLDLIVRYVFDGPNLTPMDLLIKE